MKMQSMLKITFLMSAIYHHSVRYVYYDDSLFLFYGLLWAPMFDHSVWSVIIVDNRYSVEAWPLITDDGGHVTLGWSEIMGGYNTPDTVVKHRRRK